MKKIKVGKKQITEIENFNNNRLIRVVNELNEHISKNMDDEIINGLKIKGFSFDNKQELNSFLKDRCTIESCPDLKQTTYLIDKKPFLIWFYGNDLTINPNFEDYTIKVNYGSYMYL